MSHSQNQLGDGPCGVNAAAERDALDASAASTCTSCLLEDLLISCSVNGALLQDRKSMSDLIETPPPPDQFNVAQYFLDVNKCRPEKLAFVDDERSMTYGSLERRVQAVSGGLAAMGLRPEERILLMLHDCVDWPVAFLGAIYAGLIPVPVNTLLTSEDYVYMLEHSRAGAVFVSGALLGTLTEAIKQANHTVGMVVVSRPLMPLDPVHIEFEDLLERAAPSSRSFLTRADDPAFWLYSSGSTGRPKATVHSQSNPYWTTELYGKGVLGLVETDVCFSAAKLFFAYGLGNALTFPMSVGATTVLMPERPTPAATFKRLTGGVANLRPTVFFGAPTGFAGMLDSSDLPPRDQVSLRLVSSAGEALPPELGRKFKAHFEVDIIDGIGSTEMLHIFLSNRPEMIRYGTTGWAVPGYQIELRAEDGKPVADGDPGDLYIRGPSAAMMYWGNRAKSRETFQGEWTKSGDKYIRNSDGTYTYGGRSDDMLKISGIYVSPFEVEATLVHQIKTPLSSRSGVFSCKPRSAQPNNPITTAAASMRAMQGAPILRALQSWLNPTSCWPEASCIETSPLRPARLSRVTTPGNTLTPSCAGNAGAICTAVALHKASTDKPGAKSSSCSLSRVMRATRLALPPRSSRICTEPASARRLRTVQGRWLRMLVRKPRAAKPRPALADGVLRCSSASARARAWASNAAPSSTCCPAGVSTAPPPPEPPTAFSKSGAPARLLKVSTACHAAL